MMILRATMLVVAGVAAIAGTIDVHAEAPLLDGFVRHSEQGHAMTKAVALPVVVQHGHYIEPLKTNLGPFQFAAGPGANGFDTQLHVVQCMTGQVIKIDALGVVTPFADLGSFEPLGAQPWAPTFDVLGTYSGSMLLGDTSGVVEVETEGATAQFDINAPVGHDVMILACDPYGAFGGALFAIDEAGWVQTVAMDGSMTMTATGLGLDRHAMAFGPGGGFGDDLYIADEEHEMIYRVPADHLPGDPVVPWLDLSGLNVRPISIAMSTGGPMGTDVLYVMDGRSRALLKFGADGSFLGPVVVGLGGSATISIPDSGQFADTVLIGAKGTIWVLSAD